VSAFQKREIVKIFLEKEEKLWIISLKKRVWICLQAGEYLCLAQNGVGSPAQRTIRLQVSCK
jgi:hypothetical protein